jgi:hypothetical protein
VNRPSPQFVLAALALATGAAACGNDDSAAREYREQASALCRDALRKAEEIPLPSSPQQIEPVLRDTLRLSRSFTKRLEALEPPAELADLHARSDRLNQRAEELTQQVVDDLAAGGAPQELLTEYYAKLLDIAKRDNQLARKLGLPDCVTPLPGPGGEAPAPA